MAKPKRKKKIAIFTTVVMAGCILTAVWLISTRYDYPLAAREYDKALADYKKAGFYYKDGAFIPPFEVAPLHLDNSPRLLDQAVQVLYNKGESFVRQERNRIAKLTKARDYKGLFQELESVKKPLDLMVKAANEPNPTTSYSDTEPLGDWLLARAEAKAGLKDADGALQDLRASYKLAPIISPWAVRGQSFSQTLRCAVLLKNDLKSLETIAGLIANYKAMNLSEEFRGAAGVMPKMLETIDLKTLEEENPLLVASLSRKTPKPAPPFWEPADKKIVSWISPEMRRKAYITRSLQLIVEMDQIMRATEGDLLALDAEAGKLAQKVTSRTAKSWAFAQTFGYGSLTAYGTRYRDFYGPQVAQQRTASACAEALIYKQKNNRFPTQTTYKDPFTNQPLKQKQTPQGVQIYSVGRNQKDDKGTGDDISAILRIVHK